jgi:hypothetical protein
VPWRDLPDELGPCKTVFNRFDRWSKNGRWHELFAALQTDVDAEWQSIDSTINRAHQHATLEQLDPRRPRPTEWTSGAGLRPGRGRGRRDRSDRNERAFTLK